MSKSIKLSAVRVHDLVMVVKSLSPQEVAKHSGADTIDNLHGVCKLKEELEEADKEYAAVASKIDKAVEKVRDEFQVELKKVQGDKVAEEKLLKEANAEVKKVFEKEKFEEAKSKVVEVKIGSNDRHKLLKLLLEKVGTEKYINIDAFVETLDAVDAAVEA